MRILKGLFVILFSASLGWTVMEVLELRKKEECKCPQPPVYTIIRKEMIVTGYSCDPISINYEKWRDGRTATMKKARRGLCAADWKIHPPGTLLYVPGYGLCEIQDRGAKIKGNRIDLFFDTKEEALKWGVKRIDVFVINVPIGKEV